MELFHTRKVFCGTHNKIRIYEAKNKTRKFCAGGGCRRIARLDKAERFWSKSSQNVIA
jgi:hypothetical protein